MSLAESGKKVLFIDADLRKSVLVGRHRVTEEVKGLSHFLSGQAEVEAVMYKTQEPGLVVMFAGVVPPNPAELLGQKRFEALISSARKVYDYIIIDAPPLGSVIDSAIIGVICFVGMSVLGMPFTLLISVIVGVTNVIPFFGPFIGAIPSVMILLMASPIDAIKFAIFVLALQQFDGNILGPKILGDSTGLSAIWVLVAIIVGGGLFGFAGMVVACPPLRCSIRSPATFWLTG